MQTDRRGVLALALAVVAGCSGSNEYCGNGFCAGGSETCSSCPADCGSCAACGDSICAGGESCAGCPGDCGPCPGCGDGMCGIGEDCGSCPGDCGACTTSCTPGTCAGCCDGDSCVSGTAASGCGSGGNACMVCGPSFVCAAGTCAVDPASRWNVVLETLTVPTRTYNGGDWDAFGGAPDPFVEIRIGSETATPVRSGAGDNTFTVNFDGGPTATNARADALRALLRFDVFDLDTSIHDFVGACAYRGLEDSVFVGGSQTLTCPANASTMNSGFTLRWHLERF